MDIKELTDKFIAINYKYPPLNADLVNGDFFGRIEIDGKVIIGNPEMLTVPTAINPHFPPSNTKLVDWEQVDWDYFSKIQRDLATFGTSVCLVKADGSIQVIDPLAIFIPVSGPPDPPIGSLGAADALAGVDPDADEAVFPCPDCGSPCPSEEARAHHTCAERSAKTDKIRAELRKLIGDFS